MKKTTAMLLGLLAAAAFLLLLAFRTFSFAPVGVTVQFARRSEVEDARLDLNRASAEELQELPGIGPVLSEELVAWRDAHGGFRSVDELSEVPGIGEKTIAALRDYVYIGKETNP